MTRRCSKITKVTTAAKKTANNVATIFLYDVILSFGIPLKVVTDNGPQFASRNFTMICVELGIFPLTETNYDLQCDGQVERFNDTIVSSLRHYTSEHQQE